MRLDLSPVFASGRRYDSIGNYLRKRFNCRQSSDDFDIGESADLLVRSAKSSLGIVLPFLQARLALLSLPWNFRGPYRLPMGKTLAYRDAESNHPGCQKLVLGGIRIPCEA